MLRYEERLYDFLVCQKDARGSLSSNGSFIITDTEAQSICNALEMDDTSGLNYLSKDEVKNLTCISDDKKKMLWKLVKAVKKDRRYAPDLGISCESIANILKNIKGI
jgi:ribosomal protein S13